MDKHHILQVGDRLYSERYGVWRGPYRITRVTATQAIAKASDGVEWRFRRVAKDGHATPIPNDTWSVGFFLASPEIEQEIKHHRRAAELKEIEWINLSPELVEQVYELCKAETASPSSNE